MAWGLKSGTTVNVRFTYDINGILEVEAKVPATGNVVSAVFVSNSEAMTAENIALALDKIKKLKIHPREAQENLYLLERAKRMYANFLGEERQALAQALTQFELALDSQDEQFIRPLRARFKEYLDSMDRGFVL
jgi:molecular chaperone HscC